MASTLVRRPTSARERTLIPAVRDPNPIDIHLEGAIEGHQAIHLGADIIELGVAIAAE